MNKISPEFNQLLNNPKEYDKFVEWMDSDNTLPFIFTDNKGKNHVFKTSNTTEKFEHFSDEDLIYLASVSNAERAAIFLNVLAERKKPEEKQFEFNLYYLVLFLLGLLAILHNMRFF